MVARRMMVAGTASHAGKSWFATAICRYLRRRGLRVAPFKAQNMSLNSYPCREGGEIGRAQVAQAEACGLDPSCAMNPILLKPNSDCGSQVIVDGQVWRNLGAREYYEHFEYLNERVMAAFRKLEREYEYIVMEGAGSVTEMNLKRADLVNLGLARRVEAPVLLVADIDRGGVFASLVGTFALLEPCEAELVRSFAINRFRGDPALFEDGVRFLEDRTARKCLGVFPHAPDIHLDAEDGVSLDGTGGRGAVAIVRVPRVSNFTDFDLLPDAAWIDAPAARQFDCVILPGSKSVIAGLQWMRERGLDRWVLDQAAGGARVVGVCGGYQMLGETIEDPHEAESSTRWAKGLGLLPVSTVLEERKTTRRVDAETPAGARFQAYEIHMGRTEAPPDAVPFAIVSGLGPEGMRRGRVYGTYLHGALENPTVLEEVTGVVRLAPVSKDAMYDRMADWFERNASVRRFEEMYL